MASIFDLLERIRERPTMYAGGDTHRAQLDDIEQLLNGYTLALGEHDLTEVATDFNKEFAAYLWRTREWSASCGPVAAVFDAVADDEASWNKYWELVEEFKRSLGAEATANADAELDVSVPMPAGLARLTRQNLVDLSPWLVMDRESVQTRMAGLRTRYTAEYVPFARRVDNDDLACLDPARPGRVVIVHDFASSGWELRREYPSFWDWFRSAVDDMIESEATDG
jgi:hypothetical protein